jgi:hypothetical protein
MVTERAAADRAESVGRRHVVAAEWDGGLDGGDERVGAGIAVLVGGDWWVDEWGE